MSLKPYPAYKDSGLAWLGQVPEHWPLRPFWALFRRQKKTGYENEQLLSVYRDYGVIPKASRDDNFNNASEDLTTYQLVEPGDLAINKMKAWQGSVGVSNDRGIVSPAYFVYKTLHKENSAFLHYLLRSPQYTAGYMLFSKGIRVNQWDLDPQYHSRMPVLLPPRDEQAAIAEFLDRETGKIDELIAKQEKLIALVAEKRQATISHAVTKGLNPTVPMKHSGVEWLGQIPAHWTACAARRIVRKIEQGWSPECENRPAETSEWGVLKTGCVNRGVFVAIENKALPATLEPLPEYEVQAGDILMSRASGSRELIGSVAYVFDVRPGLMLSDKIFRLRLDEAVDSRFFVYLFNSVALREQIVLAISGAEGLANNLPQSEIRSFAISVPPKAEQRQIVNFLDSELAKLTSLNQEAARVIDILKERRAALISAAVTGKIDVRQRSAEIIDLAVARRRLRGLLAVELIEKSQGRATFGRTALQKHAYLAEAFAGIYELGGRYVRNDYGPLDRDMIDDMESEAQALCGIVTQPPTGANRSVTYLLSRQTGTISNELAQQLGPNRSAKLQRLHALLASLNTHDVEGVATLFAVWNDFLIEHEAPTDDDIVNGFLNDWHPKKSENFTAQELHLRLKWMRDHHLVPTGAGPKTETGRLFV